MVVGLQVQQALSFFKNLPVAFDIFFSRKEVLGKGTGTEPHFTGLFRMTEDPT
jgi:hypothetical protein